MKALQFPFFLSLALGALIGCHDQNVAQTSESKLSAIVGGEVAQVSEYPWQVSIRDKNGKHYCGGSIISDRAVITAAHCMEHSDAKNVRVAAGGASGKEADQRYLPEVDRVIVHDGWTGGYGEPVNHDIALITFKRDIRFNRNLKAVALPTIENVPFSISQYFSFLSSELVASGWGRTRSESESPTQLRAYHPYPLASAQDTIFWTYEAQHHYIFADLGRRMLGGNFLVSDTQGQSTCSGDSGGPLVAMEGSEFKHTTLIGLTSAGGDTTCSNVVFHTNVQLYLEWIEESLR